MSATDLSDAAFDLRNQLAALQAERQRLVDVLLLAERDRQMLGYELHDGILQELTGAALMLEKAAELSPPAPGQSLDNFSRGLELIRLAIVEVRRVMSGTTAVELTDATLGQALERLADRYRTLYGLNVSFEGPKHRLRLTTSARYLLLRIAQEALNNAWKHAPTSNVQIRLVDEAAQLTLTVSDDGQGFDTHRSKPGHFGLDGMRARAHLLGAEYHLDSTPGQGTRVTVRLALGEREA
jgi:signal transduction histidine kinase